MKTRIWLDNSISLEQMGKLGLFILLIAAMLLLLVLINKMGRIWARSRQAKMPSKLSLILGLNQQESEFLQDICLDQRQLSLIVHDQRVLDVLLFHTYLTQMEQGPDETKLDFVFRIYQKRLARTPLPAVVLDWKHWPIQQEVWISSLPNFKSATLFYLLEHRDHGELICECSVPPLWPSAQKLFVFYPHAGSGVAFSAQQRGVVEGQDRCLLRLRILQLNSTLSEAQQWPPPHRLYNRVAEANFIADGPSEKRRVAKEEIMLRHISPETCTLLLRCPQTPFHTIVLPLYLEKEQQAYNIPLLPKSWQPLLGNGEVDRSRKPFPADYRPSDQQAWQLTAQIHPDASLISRNRMAATTYRFYDRYYSRIHSKRAELPRVNLKELRKTGETEQGKTKLNSSKQTE